MAQDFERGIAKDIGTTASTLWTADSDDAVVGIMISNTTASQILVDVYITNTLVDYYLVQSAPIPSGSALQLLDGGAKVVMQNGDVLKIESDTATSADAWVSVIDSVSV